jgi:hypothetical protein
MLLNKKIPSSIVPEIGNMVEYLKTNNIFKYERRKFSEECSSEILKLLFPFNILALWDRGRTDFLYQKDVGHEKWDSSYPSAPQVIVLTVNEGPQALVD